MPKGIYSIGPAQRHPGQIDERGCTSEVSVSVIEVSCGGVLDGCCCVCCAFEWGIMPYKSAYGVISKPLHIAHKIRGGCKSAHMVEGVV